jgi:ABC-2 type transport system permease protein
VTRLLAAEVDRALSRRLIRLFAALIVVGIVIAAVAVYFGDSQFELRNLTEIFKGTSVLLILVVWLLAASFLGADWQSGVVGTTLTWEPRRVRLVAAKVAAFAAVSALAVLLTLALLGAALLPAAAVNGTTAGTDSAWLSSLVWTSLRISAAAVLAAAASISIVMFGRRTSAAVATGFLYLAVIESIVRGTLPGMQPWLIGDNAAVFIDGHKESSLAGRSPLAAGIYLTACAAALLVAAAVWFRRRDVS